MDELDEVLDIQQRQKRAMIIRRYKTKIERAKEVAKSKMAPDKIIKKRAYAQARQIVRKRFAGQRGAEYEKLGPSEKMAIDRAIDKKQALIKKIALRLIPRVKQAEAKRLGAFMHGASIENHGKPEGNSKVNEEFSSFFSEKYDDLSANQLPDENKTQEVKKAKKGKSNNQIKFYNKFGEEVSISRAAYEALEKKADKSGIDIDTLGEVYNRGRSAWVEGGKVTQEQYAFARVNSFINQGRSYFEEDADLHGEELVEKRGLWDNIHAKRKRIKAGSGERMRKPGSKGAPTAQNFKDAQESTEIEESFRKFQIQQNLGKSKKEFLSPSNTVGGMATKRIHHNEKHDIEVYHGMQVYKTTPHYVFHNDKLVHMTTSRDNAMKHAEKLGKKLDREEKKSIKEDTLDELSRGTLVNYTHKAIHTAMKTSDATPEGKIKREKRLKGAGLASKKLGYTKEETEIDESNNTPYVRPHIEKGSTKQTAWKASNKHGRVKYFGMDFKKSAEKHAGIAEETQIDEMDKTKGSTRSFDNFKGQDKTAKPITTNKAKDDAKKALNKAFAEAASCDCDEKQSIGTKIRKKMEVVDRAPKTPGVYTKQAEIKNKIIDEEHSNCGTPECCGQCESAGNSQNDPAKRLVGTDSLVKAFKKDTSGQGGDLNESFNIAFAAGVGVSLTAADLGMKAQGGFELHPSVIAEMQAREEEIEEDVSSAVKKPVYVPPIRRADGTYTPSKTVMRKTGKKIIKGDGSSHDGN